MTNDSERASDWIVWIWQYHHLQMEPCGSREDAISLAVGIEDNGDGSLQCIEAPDGSLVPQDEIDAYSQAKDDARRQQMAAEPKRTHRVVVTAPNGRDGATWGAYAGREAAEGEATTLRARFPGRVKVEALRL